MNEAPTLIFDCDCDHVLTADQLRQIFLWALLCELCEQLARTDD